ncbi:PH domain-containing protein [Bacillus sp. Bva_UNVM-123]|uniref:PH domain-containing protein n=1 Tax=Bacillus sp. Bva_UNVM-123 TaxID=2829798 RepID=UPI00391F9D1E
MSEPRRLHPITTVINCLKALKDLFFPFLIFVVFGSKNGFFQLGMSAIIIIIVLISGILSWLRFTYRLEEGELRIEYGVFVRKKRYIPFERIQSLDLSEGIFQRPFGLVRVNVETAGSSGSSEAEAVLTAISKEEAELIQQTMFSAKVETESASGETVTEKSTEEIIYRISSRELLLLASTSGGAGVVLSAVIAFASQFEEIIPYEKVFRGLADFLSNGIVFVSMLIFIGFLIAWIAALIGTMIKYAGFTVKKSGHDLIISRGLLEKRQLTIPLHRIQAIQISENIIRQPFGYSTVFVENAGGSALNNEGARVMLLPIIKKQQMLDILSPYLPDYQFDIAINPAPKRALKRYMIRGLLVTAPFVIVPIVFFRPWGYLSLLLLLLSLFFSYLKYKDAGWKVDEQQLTLRSRFLIRNTILMRRNRIQSLRTQESYFQRKKQLATIGAVVMSGSGGSGGVVVDLEKKDVSQIYEWYSYTKHSNDLL